LARNASGELPASTTEQERPARLNAAQIAVAFCSLVGAEVIL
jgi:hypothetical protein